VPLPRFITHISPKDPHRHLPHDVFPALFDRSRLHLSSIRLALALNPAPHGIARASMQHAPSYSLYHPFGPLLRRTSMPCVRGAVLSPDHTCIAQSPFDQPKHDTLSLSNAFAAVHNPATESFRYLSLRHPAGCLPHQPLATLVRGVVKRSGLPFGVPGLICEEEFSFLHSVADGSHRSLGSRDALKQELRVQAGRLLALSREARGGVALEVPVP